MVTKEKDILDRMEDTYRKVSMVVEVSLRLMESEKEKLKEYTMKTALSDSAACGFNHFCYETLDELNLILEECRHRIPRT